MRITLLKADLRELELPKLLQALALGRQYMGVELREGGAVIGTVYLKSGKVASAVEHSSQGLQACLRLFQRTQGEVEVFRSETPDTLAEPLGSIDKLLQEAEAQRGADGTVPSDAIATAIAESIAAGPPPLPSGEGGLPVEVSPAPPPARSITEAPPRRMTPPPARSVTPPPLPPPRSITPPPLPAARSAAPPARRTAPPPAPAPELAQIRGAKAASPGKLMAVASPKGGCGKTTISLNLALSLARQGRSVILVDADINGDVLSSINARQRAEIGAFDVLLGVAGADEALLDTVLPHFKILPAVGGQLPRAELLAADRSAGWRALLLELGKRADVVLVDTPAGMYGVTHQVLEACTHVVGVLQAEVVANRSFSRFVEALRAMPDELRPEVLGIVVNMLQTKHAASLSVFQTACSDLPGDWLFDTTIPRHRAFLDATALGLPLRHLDEQSPPAVAWLFDNLAAEVAERLRLGTVEKKPQPLLL
jgi:chromosome partitioning protein